MAKSNKKTFLVGIAREGENGSIRAKIPAGMIKEIGAKEGQAIEFMVHGDTLVGAKVLTAKEYKIAKKEKDAEAPAKSTKPAKSVKKVGKVTKKTTEDAPKIKGGKKVKPVTKPSKRKTEVEYEAPAKKKKGNKFGKIKLGKK